MIPVPSGKQELLAFANDLVEQCRVSVGMRSSYYRQLNMVAETGRYDGMKSLINMLNFQLIRAADHLFSPVQLKFSIDFERPRPKVEYERAKAVAEVLTRTWERQQYRHYVWTDGGFRIDSNTDAAIHKQWVQLEGSAESSRFIMTS